MRTRQSLSSLRTPGLGQEAQVDGGCGIGSGVLAVRPALLAVSNDTALCARLRRASGGEGRSVVEAGDLVEALQAVRSVGLAAVLLDLDMPSQGAWQIADGLLREEACPPVILLTGRREQFDMSTAIRAGTLIDKTAECERLMEAVEQAVALPESNRAERNAIQWIMIQWLRPCEWSVPITPAGRDWGLNE
jgi:DNA-binding response OmpR family regulator